MKSEPENRRAFLTRLAVAAAGLGVASPLAADRLRAMKLCLVGGSIGVRADQREAIDLAARHGFDAVEPQTGYVARLEPAALEELQAELAARQLVWGQAGFPVDFRGSDSDFEQGLAALPKTAANLKAAGVDRVGTWLSPSHPNLPYVRNFRLHATRLRPAARILADHGLRLGLEYVGTHTLLVARRYPFIHTLAETLDLIGEIGTDNVGIVADSWHWWQAGDSAADLRALRAEQVVSVDLNDAPTGRAKNEQRDGERELPATTGVIDLRGFLGALSAIGFDGPIRAEPFNRALNELDNEAACAATITALRRAMEALG